MMDLTDATVIYNSPNAVDPSHGDSKTHLN